LRPVSHGFNRRWILRRAGHTRLFCLNGPWARCFRHGESASLRSSPNLLT
jgi:hypothetical protein